MKYTFEQRSSTISDTMLSDSHMQGGEELACTDQEINSEHCVGTDPYLTTSRITANRKLTGTPHFPNPFLDASLICTIDSCVSNQFLTTSENDLCQVCCDVLRCVE